MITVNLLTEQNDKHRQVMLEAIILANGPEKIAHGKNYLKKYPDDDHVRFHVADCYVRSVFDEEGNICTEKEKVFLSLAQARIHLDHVKTEELKEKARDYSQLVNLIEAEVLCPDYSTNDSKNQTLSLPDELREQCSETYLKQPLEIKEGSKKHVDQLREISNMLREIMFFSVHNSLEYAKPHPLAYRFQALLSHHRGDLEPVPIEAQSQADTDVIQINPSAYRGSLLEKAAENMGEYFNLGFFQESDLIPLLHERIHRIEDRVKSITEGGGSLDDQFEVEPFIFPNEQQYMGNAVLAGWFLSDKSPDQFTFESAITLLEKANNQAKAMLLSEKDEKKLERYRRDKAFIDSLLLSTSRQYFFRSAKDDKKKALAKRIISQDKMADDMRFYLTEFELTSKSWNKALEYLEPGVAHYLSLKQVGSTQKTEEEQKQFNYLKRSLITNQGLAVYLWVRYNSNRRVPEKEKTYSAVLEEIKGRKNLRSTTTEGEYHLLLSLLADLNKAKDNGDDTYESLCTIDKRIALFGYDPLLALVDRPQKDLFIPLIRNIAEIATSTKKWYQWI